MKTPPVAFSVLLLAFLSGTPALIYQVVWTRQVGLIAGGQIGAISVVLVAFFGGLAIGAWFFGRRSDRVASPLRLYAALEVGAGLMALVAAAGLNALGRADALDEFALLAASALLLLPVTFLLGGTLPALLCARSPAHGAASGAAGRLIGSNTTGSVVGVALAIFSIPAFGLRATLFAAAAGSIGIGAMAAVLAGARKQATIEQAAPASIASTKETSPHPSIVLMAAFLVGVSTLGFEVLATRLATLRLGSSLYAWGAVLALFLVGLAAGNLASAGRARRTPNPERDLGWIEIMAACAIALGLAVLQPSLSAPGSTLSAAALTRVAIGVFPAAFSMGAAFPLLVRLGVRDAEVGQPFGRLSAVNTIGGIGGALVAPFVLLPALGSVGAGLVFMATNAGVGLGFLADRRRVRSGVAASVCLVAAGLPLLWPIETPDEPRVLFISEGRQAIAVVTSFWGDRTLFVDGDPEAGTGGDARRTEELLAVLPLLLHPAPEAFLEIGLGSGITLGTATRFPLERIDCIEIAGSVIEAATYFEPDNRGVARSGPARIVHGDARRHLANSPNRYDVVSANTLHPWSVGATGLYSREYFSRMSDSLRPGGLAVQWIPTEQIGAQSLSLILRTFFDVFPHGGVWWGAGNIIAVGARAPLPEYDVERADQRLKASGMSWRRLGWETPDEPASHFIADAREVRAGLGEGDVLVDDQPRLEFFATRRPGRARAAEIFQPLIAIAKQNVGNGAMLFWLESRALRAAGDETGANAREALAADLGLRIAARARLDRDIAAAHESLRAGRLDAAARGFDLALREDPDQRYALFGRAGLAIQQGRFDDAIRDLDRVVRDWPEDVRAWNELAGIHSRRGDLEAAERALDGALAANPYDIRALANAGLIAIESREPGAAEAFLQRIRAISPLGPSPQEVFLADALSGRRGR